MKKILKAARGGVRKAAVVFLMYCIIFGLLSGNDKFAGGYGIARAAIVTIFIGVGFGAPTVVYETDLPAWLKVLIHMGTGCTVMVAASLFFVWLPMQRSLPAILATTAIQVATAFALWGIAFIPAAVQAKKINQKMKEKLQDGE